MSLKNAIRAVAQGRLPGWLRRIGGRGPAAQAPHTAATGTWRAPCPGAYALLVDIHRNR